MPLLGAAIPYSGAFCRPPDAQGARDARDAPINALRSSFINPVSYALLNRRLADDLSYVCRLPNK